MTHLFLAIDLPVKQKTSLFSQLEALRNLYPQFSWVIPENYHITLYFFGQVNDQNKIKEKLKNILFREPKFLFYSFKLGLFINRKKIIIYLDFRREKNLEITAKLIQDSFVSPWENRSDQKFVPHLTVARYKLPSKQQYLALKKRLEKTDIEFEFIASKITLFESFFSGKNPHYKKIAQFPLG